jgi:hypothetical protein
MLRILQEKGRKQKEELFNEIGSQLMFWKARALREKVCLKYSFGIDNYFSRFL